MSKEEHIPAESCELLNKTIELLKTCGKSPAIIAKETGLSFYWLQSMRYNKNIDPSVVKTVKLYEYLKGEKLEIA